MPRCWWMPISKAGGILSASIASGSGSSAAALGPSTDGVTIDVYDSSGDYLGSGIDGLTINVHGNAQDQLGQIIKTRETGYTWRCRADIHVRRQRRLSLCHGQCGAAGR